MLCTVGAEHVYVSPKMDSQPPFLFVSLLSDYSFLPSLLYVVLFHLYVQVASHLHFQRLMPPHLHSLGFIIKCTLYRLQCSFDCWFRICINLIRTSGSCVYVWVFSVSFPLLSPAASECR